MSNIPDKVLKRKMKKREKQKLKILKQRQEEEELSAKNNSDAQIQSSDDEKQLQDSEKVEVTGEKRKLKHSDDIKKKKSKHIWKFIIFCWSDSLDFLSEKPKTSTESKDEDKNEVSEAEENKEDCKY